jgi:putative peptide zinc metalloprotease protein
MPGENTNNLSFGAQESQEVPQTLPKVRSDVEITEQVYYGKPCYVLKDPTTLRYYRLRPPEYTIYRMLDGEATLDDVLKVLAERFPEEEYDRQAVMNFIIMLRGASLLQGSGAESTEYLLKRKEMMKKGFIKKIRREFLFYRIPILDPDRMLNWLERNLGGFVFSRFLKIISLLVFLGALALAITHIDKFSQRQPLLDPINILMMIPILIVIKAIHEIGHGLTCKHYDCEVHEMGILFLVFMPCAYCDVSDSWMISQKHRRMWITAAGIVIEIMLASLATYIWVYTQPKTVINQMALNTMVVASLNSIMFNGNPLLRYDGYYFLMDLMEIPNLKQKGSGYLWYLMQRYVLGVKEAQKPLDVQGREVGVLGYGICSAIYRWFIMFAIVTMIWKFLDPYGWGVVGAVMAIGCIYNAFITPVIKFFKFLITKHEQIHLHIATAVILVLLIGGTIYGVLALPVEQSVEGQCVLRPTRLYPIYVTQAGFIDPSQNPTFVRDGQFVEPNQVLLVLSDPQLQQKVDDLALQLKKVEVQISQESDRSNREQLQAMREGLQEQYDWAQKKLAKLTLRAPLKIQGKSGRWIIQRRIEMPLDKLTGSFLPVGTELFAVYDPSEFEAVTAINNRDIGQVKRNMAVEIKLWAWDADVLESRVEQEPMRIYSMSNPAFSTAFKGEVQTMPAADMEDVLIPAEITHELVLSVTDAQGRMRDGIVGRTKIIIEKQTLGRAFYRWLLQTLRMDIRL